MQDWRPFVSSFVANTYTEYSQRVLQEEALARRRGLLPVPPLFSYTPSAKDVEIQAQQFRSLQVKVQRQRKLIKIRDKSWTKTRWDRREVKPRESERGMQWKEGISSTSNTSMVKSEVLSERELVKKTHRKTRSNGGSLELPAPLSHGPKEAAFTPACSSLPPVPCRSTFWVTELPTKVTSK